MAADLFSNDLQLGGSAWCFRMTYSSDLGGSTIVNRVDSEGLKFPSVWAPLRALPSTAKSPFLY